jgi:hypothetical protein
MGVVPQHERRPRPIVDFTFSDVNDDTVSLTPREAMQFGRAFDRLIHQVVQADPRFGPVQFMKLDIADGFYRVWLRAEDVPKLGVAVPSLPGEPPLVALPLALPMGWTESPPAFSAVTETIADVANRRLQRGAAHKTAPHRLDAAASTPSHDAIPLALPAPSRTPTTLPQPDQPPPLRSHNRRLQTIEVYVDDFIAAAQGSPQRLNRIRRVLMTAIDDVFRPLSPHDHEFRTEPISIKKLLKGDGSWATVKKVLGWIIDTVSMTLTLPQRRLDRLADLLDSIQPTQKRLSKKRWHQLLGELRSMALAIPGARGLFSHLQAASHSDLDGRLRLTNGFHGAIDDLRWLHTHMADRPTRLYELVPTQPVLTGYHDASGIGAGGVLLPSHPSLAPRSVLTYVRERDGHFHRKRPLHSAPILWRHAFPSLLRDRLVSYSNPRGSLTNSELELAGAFLHQEAAAQCFDIRERTLRSGTDNIATLYWSRKGSATTTSPTASLLRQMALHQRCHRYIPLRDYEPGVHNRMADDASRLFHLTDCELLTHFNLTYPQPQPWRMYHLPPPTISSAISALLKRKSPTESFLHVPRPPQPIGTNGRNTALRLASIRPYGKSPIPSPISKSLPTASATATLTPLGDPSANAPWKVPYGPLVKRSPLWGPRTHVLPPKANSSFA